MAWQLPQLNFRAEEEEKPSKEWPCTKLVRFCGGGWETGCILAWADIM